MSQLKVNSIVPAGGLTSGANGGIVQIVNSHKKTKTTITASSSFQATGLSATITPSSNNSKILVVVNGIYSVNNSTNTQYMSLFKLYNGSSEITDATSTAGSQENAWKVMFEVSAQSGNHQQFELLPIQGDYLYTHGGSAGSAITINLFAKSHNAEASPTAIEMFFNGRNQTNFGGTSSMTLMELGG